MASELRLVIITGLSGAGKTQAIRAFEDLEFFCVDNLPPALLPRFAELCAAPGTGIDQVAAVVDIRGRVFFDDALQALGELDRLGFPYQILFLEASDEVLVARFKETRRPHPLAPDGRILEGIRAERRRLETLRGRASWILDTSEFRPRDLREHVKQLFSGGERDILISIVSFGFKHGLPRDADLVLDVRFLPNPHYVPSLRPLPGTDRQVEEYVLSWPATQAFLDLVKPLLDFLVPQYVAEGKSQLTIAVGCTGGRHRSVVVANALAEYLRRGNRAVVVEHRDCDLVETGNHA